MEIQIRPELQSEYQLVEKVNRDAFNRDEEANLVQKLRSTPNYIPELSLVACNKNEIIGHINVAMFRKDVFTS